MLALPLMLTEPGLAGVIEAPGVELPADDPMPMLLETVEAPLIGEDEAALEPEDAGAMLLPMADEAVEEGIGVTVTLTLP